VTRSRAPRKRPPKATTGEASFTLLPTEEEKIVGHALEILPHLGPDATVVYLQRASDALPPEHESPEAAPEPEPAT
jgi:hypothetical protein